MEDMRILDLYWERSEDAVAQTARKYGRYCYAIAYGILESESDAEEIVNDTYLKVWNTIPPERPAVLSSYVGMICRQLSINRYHAQTAQKRGGGQVEEAEEELVYCLPSYDPDPVEMLHMQRVLNQFLRGLPKQSRVVFLRRYWYLNPVSQIARDCSMTEGAVKMLLHRTRKKLKDFLRKEGIEI